MELWKGNFLEALDIYSSVLFYFILLISMATHLFKELWEANKIKTRVSIQPWQLWEGRTSLNCPASSQSFGCWSPPLSKVDKADKRCIKAREVKQLSHSKTTKHIRPYQSPHLDFSPCEELGLHGLLVLCRVGSCSVGQVPEWRRNCLSSYSLCSFWMQVAPFPSLAARDSSDHCCHWFCTAACHLVVASSKTSLSSGLTP